LQGVALRYGMIFNFSATFAKGKQFTERQREFTKPQVSIHERIAFNSPLRTVGRKFIAHIVKASKKAAKKPLFL